MDGICSAIEAGLVVASMASFSIHYFYYRSGSSVNESTYIEDEVELSQHYFNLGIYAAIVAGLVVASMARTIYFFVLCMRGNFVVSHG